MNTQDINESRVKAWKIPAVDLAIEHIKETVSEIAEDIADDEGPKKQYLVVMRPETHGSQWCVSQLKGFDIQGEFDGAEIGERIVLELIEMTDRQFEALGEFQGW